MTTRGTEIAAIDAARNEAQVLAEGGVLGERRAARARLAMIVAFGLIAITTKQTSMVMMAMGTAYFAFAVGAIVVLARTKPSPEGARWRPIAVATLDTVFVGSQGVLSAYTGTPFQPGMLAVAVAIVRDMQRVVIELNAHRATRDLPPIKIGIGIHTGTVAAGMLGGKLQAEYTVIGDAVNVASRVESLTKEHGADILVSETTWAQLPPALQADCRRLDPIAIRGRKEPIVLYAI